MPSTINMETHPKKLKRWLMIALLLSLLVVLPLLYHIVSKTDFTSQYLKSSTGRATYLTDHNLTKLQDEDSPSRLGDGCYHVFLDVGANIGVHGRFLFEPAKYPDSPYSVPLFRDQFGDHRSNEDFCVFEVEANPKHWPRLDNVSQAYQKMGWRYHVVKAAAGDKHGTMSFHHQNDEKDSEWGFSVNKLPEGNVETVEIPTIRLAEWLQHEIFDRKIPEVPASGKKYKKPIIGMKMDIEGSEYIVLPDMILSGTYCHLDFLFGETHPKFAPFNFTGHRVPLNTIEDARKLQESLFLTMKSSRNCPTKFFYLDDESYLHDGQPLPNATAPLPNPQDLSTVWREGEREVWRWDD
jgi:Methyltransferase FkbM domain